MYRGIPGNNKKLGIKPTDEGMNKKPTQKPHGRLAWSIFFSRDGYLDLSVMPHG